MFDFPNAIGNGTMATAPATTHILDLLGRLDTAWLTEPDFGKNPDWKPQTPEIAAVIAEIISPENRAALSAWYGRSSKSQMNPSALWLCEYLERTTNTKLAKSSS